LYSSSKSGFRYGQTEYQFPNKRQAFFIAHKKTAAAESLSSGSFFVTDNQ